MPYKASARPFFFPAAGRRSAIAAFHSEMFPLFLRGITLSAGRRSIPDTRRAASVSADPTAAIRPRPGHRTHGPPCTPDEEYIVTSPQSGSPTIVSGDHSLQIRTVPPGQESETTARNDFYGYIPSPKTRKGSLVHEAGIGIIAVLIHAREEATKAIYPRCRIATKSTPQKRKSGAAPVRTHSQPGPGRQRQVGKFGKTPVCQNTEPMTEIISATVCINPDIFVIL